MLSFGLAGSSHTSRPLRGSAVVCSHTLRESFASSASRLWRACRSSSPGPAPAQRKPAAQYMFSHQSPPGTVGQMRLQRGGPVVGYYQPVQISGPKGVLISMADQGDWTDPVDGPLFAGMQLGVPYRLKLANLPEHFRNLECYPTIEVIDRTYAPVGLERRFPIPIVFDEDDLRLATEGMLVTRVVYIEDPKQALPGAQQPGEQLWHDAGPKANALEVADGLGRPVAIVRLGPRTPGESAGPAELGYRGLGRSGAHRAVLLQGLDVVRVPHVEQVSRDDESGEDDEQKDGRRDDAA